MIREDRELLAELRRLNSDVVPLAMRIMDESVAVTAEEQTVFAERLVAMGQRLEARARRIGDEVIEGIAEVDGETIADAGLAADAEAVFPRER